MKNLENVIIDYLEARTLEITNKIGPKWKNELKYAAAIVIIVVVAVAWITQAFLPFININEELLVKNREYWRLESKNAELKIDNLKLQTKFADLKTKAIEEKIPFFEKEQEKILNKNTRLLRLLREVRSQYLKLLKNKQLSKKDSHYYRSEIAKISNEVD